jgi:hypothetical protein
MRVERTMRLPAMDAAKLLLFAFDLLALEGLNVLAGRYAPSLFRLFLVPAAAATTEAKDEEDNEEDNEDDEDDDEDDEDDDDDALLLVVYGGVAVNCCVVVVSPLVGVVSFREVMDEEGVDGNGIGLLSRNTRGRLVRCGGECRRSSSTSSPPALLHMAGEAVAHPGVARFLFGAPGALMTLFLFLGGGVENIGGMGREGTREAVGGASNDESFNDAGDCGWPSLRFFRCEKCSSSVLCILLLLFCVAECWNRTEEM